MRAVLIIYLAILFSSFTPKEFKNDQLRYSRVKIAYSEKESKINKILKDNSITTGNLEVYLRAFKYEKEIELWGKNKTDKEFKLLKTYKICRTSGKLGPKRKEGDFQIPEGFYHIEAFIPSSSYYLSMRINYPNKSDRILGYKPNLGGDICIHGNCVTIGCLPITDEKIKELYIFCIEAKDNGQRKIPTTFFPARLTEKNFNNLKNQYSGDSEKINLWQDLKQAYDRFEEAKQLPSIIFLENGRHQIK